MMPHSAAKLGTRHVHVSLLSGEIIEFDVAFSVREFYYSLMTKSTSILDGTC